MKQKVIFIDIDGTLTNYDNVIPQSAKDAIKLARGNKHLVFLNSGRSLGEISQEILEIGYDGYIGGNGNYISVGTSTIYHRTLSLEDCTQIVDWLIGRDLEFYLESNEGLFASKNFTGPKGQIAIKQYVSGSGRSDVKTLEITDVLHGLIENQHLYRANINKISFILDDYQDYLDAKEVFPHLKVGTWGGKGEHAIFGDIGVYGVNKSSAIHYLLNHLNIDKENTIAFGDAKIDLDMLEYCKIGVAMGSGGNEVKAIADHITDAVDDDGLYHAFKHFELI